jgi:hypothetical protein
MLATTEQSNLYNDIIVNAFGMRPEEITNIINKHTKKAENQKISSMKYYYNKVKVNDELHQRKLERNKRYYHDNKERLNEYYKNRLRDNEDIKQKYRQTQKEHYEHNKERILEKQREKYFELNKDKIRLKRGRKPKTTTPSDDEETTASDGNNLNSSSE